MHYDEKDYRSFRDEGDGPELMANFVARIVQETKFIDGLTSRSVLIITGQMPPPDGEGTDPVELPPVEVPAEDFPSMNWVMPNWGVRCVIRPGSGIKDDLRAMIQLYSKPVQRVVYKQTGWEVINGQRRYLHVGGGIGKAGNDAGITVRLPPELERYNLSCPYTPKECVQASLDLVMMARDDLTWPLLAATLTPLFGQVDFAIHLTGRTGSFKSECMSLFQSHYGAGMDARHLPGSWASTPNALEALAFFARNAAFVIDDFVPTGSAWQQRAYQANADKIIRAQGNQSGRARLTDASNLQQTMYPRGVILSTGEDTPEGHSVRARMLILEVAAGEIDPAALTAAQQMRAYYPGTVAWLCQQLAGAPVNLTPRTEELRADYRDIGHSRTPGMLGRLVATAETFVTLAQAAGFLSAKDAAGYAAKAKAAIEAAGAKQQSYLEDSDPVDVFAAGFRQALAAGTGHVRTLNGGVPLKAEILGWTAERSIGEMGTFKARGPCIGWCRWDRDELFIDVTAGYNVIKKAAGNDLTLSKMTLFKRMKDAGVLVRVDDGRQRNTVRVTAEGHPRNVLAMSLSTMLDTEEVPDGTAEEGNVDDSNDNGDE